MSQIDKKYWSLHFLVKFENEMLILGLQGENMGMPGQLHLDSAREFPSLIPFLRVFVLVKSLI